MPTLTEWRESHSVCLHVACTLCTTTADAHGISSRSTKGRAGRGMQSKRSVTSPTHAWSASPLGTGGGSSASMSSV